jgi:putative two-component system response regulator
MNHGDVMETIESIRNRAIGHTALVVEDDTSMRMIISGLLELMFKRVDIAKNGREGLGLYRENRHGVIVTDIDMPVMNGIEMIREILAIDPGQSIVVISGHGEADYLIDLINMGINHFLSKPFEKETILAVLDRVLHYKKLEEIERDYTHQLEREVAIKTRDLNESLQTISDLSDEIVLRLTSAAEYRDSDTGAHISRMAAYVDVFARAMGLDERFMEELRFAAPLHDIGKIGIPDSILLKHGTLSDDEWNIMKGHTAIGARILRGSRFASLNTASSVALTHHERWDGSGYPGGLRGDGIPLEGRIIAVCDVYDALRSRRPYKEPITHGEACRRIIEGDERTPPGHFDPTVLTAFRTAAGEMEEMFDRMED